MTNSAIASSSFRPFVSGILKYTNMTAQIEKNDNIRNPIISPYGTSSIIVKNVIHTAKFAIQLHVAAKLLPRPLKCNG